MTNNSEPHNRHSIRLRNYDYSQSGYYFITICTQDMQPIFGHIISGEMILNELGKVVEEELLRTPMIRKNIIIEHYVIMPNHIHAIIEIRNDVGADCIRPEAEMGECNPPLHSVIRGFKSATSRIIRERFNVSRIWQRGYYDHIIRQMHEHGTIIDYISNNPMQWSQDRYNI